MEALRAVLFDLDGVLIDSYEAWFRAVNAAARHFHKPDVDRDRFQASWGQGTDADLNAFFPGCKLSELEAYYEEHLLDYAAEIKVNPDAHAVMAQLRSAEIFRAVITNTPTFLARDLLAWVGLIGFVDVTVGAESGVQSKPAPDIILRACEMLQIRPNEAVVVGDTSIDDKAAKAAGAAFVGFRTSHSRAVQQLGEIVKLVTTRT